MPRRAAFRATKGEELLEDAGLKEYAFDETKDCQTALAMALLLRDDCWWPKLRPEVTPQRCTLAWTCDSELLAGTELEEVVKMKLLRLRASRQARCMAGAEEKSLKTSSRCSEKPGGGLRLGKRMEKG